MSCLWELHHQAAAAAAASAAPEEVKGEEPAPRGNGPQEKKDARCIGKALFLVIRGSSQWPDRVTGKIVGMALENGVSVAESLVWDPMERAEFVGGALDELLKQSVVQIIPTPRGPIWAIQSQSS